MYCIYLLAVVNFLKGTSMAELGAGNQATQVSSLAWWHHAGGVVMSTANRACCIRGDVVMKMTRYVYKQAAEAPAAGSNGNTIADAKPGGG